MARTWGGVVSRRRGGVLRCRWDGLAALRGYSSTAVLRRPARGAALRRRIGWAALRRRRNGCAALR